MFIRFLMDTLLMAASLLTVVNDLELLLANDINSFMTNDPNSFLTIIPDK